MATEAIERPAPVEAPTTPIWAATYVPFGLGLVVGAVLGAARTIGRIVPSRSR